MKFTSFKFPKCIANRVSELGYITPTPIQEQAIPYARAGADVMGLAQTGTGKTAAFVLPILERLLPGRRGNTRALVIAPTRELAEQITGEFNSLGKRTGLRCISIYGGVGQGPQVEKLRRGADIVVACPGRLLDLIGQRKIDLYRIEVLVLDEADRMFDMGFLPDIRKIVKHVPDERQVMLFSATMPKAIRTLAKDFMKDPETIQIGHTAPVETVSHALFPVSQHLKGDLLMELLKHTDTESVLIFTRTKHRAKRLDQQLNRAGYSAASLQGNLSQKKRQAAMDGFKNGTFRILVATDIAARGIDVNTISHVINFDIPESADAYTHRIGRTGRATRNGDAFTLVTPADEGIVWSIEKVIGSPIERRSISGFDYRKPAPPKNIGSRHRPTHHQSRPSGGHHRQGNRKPAGGMGMGGTKSKSSSRPSHSRPKAYGPKKGGHSRPIRSRA